jgi:hypothetical protein
MTMHHQGEHMLSQPGWTCRDCGERWPCDARRTILTAEAHEQSASGVRLFLSLCLEQAVQDEPSVEVEVLYDRFLGWLDKDPFTHESRAEPGSGQTTVGHDDVPCSTATTAEEPLRGI